LATSKSTSTLLELLTPGVFFLLWCPFEDTGYLCSVNPLTGFPKINFAVFPPKPFLRFYSTRLETAGLLYVSVSLINITGSSRIQTVLQKVKWPDGDTCLWLFSARTSADQRDHATQPSNG